MEALMSDDGDEKINLKEKFPEMTPVKGAPALFRLNGCGLGLYGRRDADHQTGTYVSTYCLCLIFVPVLALTAYRIADARGGGCTSSANSRCRRSPKAGTCCFA
jgi:hypothetical protein